MQRQCEICGQPFIAGDARLIARFEDLSATRVHGSPPSLAAISAAEQALALNEKRGDLLRARLVKIVRRFREKLRQIGLSALGGLFPVQTLRAIPDIDPQRLYRQLLDCGVKAVLRGFGGAVTECPMWAGTSVEFVEDLPAAAELVGRLLRECEAAGAGVDSAK